MSDKNNRMRKLSFLGFGTDKNGDPDEVKLDAEMEKVFAGPARDKDRFHLSQLLETSDTNFERKDGPPKYNEQNYGSHRKQSYQHGTRKPLTNSMKRRDSTKDYRKPSITTSQSQPDSIVTSPSSTTTGSPSISLKKQIVDDEPIVSERAGYGEHLSDTSSEGRHVQFETDDIGDGIAGKGDTLSLQAEDDNYDDTHEDLRKRKERHQHYKQRKHSLQENSNWRRQSNTEGGSTGIRRISVQPEDATLEEADIDELTSHRSDDPRGMRRHKIQPSERLARKDKDSSPPNLTMKKHYDHSPHEVFVQLDELYGTGEDREWKETARWIKYEEDVEEASDRWGRPHVASLSFHSLLNLRRCLETGVVLLDLEERDLPGVAYRVVEQMVIEELIDENDKSVVMRSLLLRHRHVNEHGGFHFGSRRKFSSYTSLQYLWMDDHETLALRNGVRSSSYTHQRHQSTNNGLLSPTTAAKHLRRHSTISHKMINLSGDTKPKILPANEINGSGYYHNGTQTYDTKIDIKEETYSASQEDLRKAQNDTILKRIPVGAEATTVLVGAVDFLKQPTIAFVRLAEGIPIPGVTEVPIPVRFIFILLGPKKVDLDYHEVGRSIATLMSNDHFHKIAYKADHRRDLLSAINEFLDESIVLPPGNWERNDLLPFDDLKARNEWIRSRKSKALKQKQKEEKQLLVDEEKKLLALTDVDGKKPPIGPLEKTHRMWGGLVNDIKRRYPMYKSDIIDGLNTETLAATIFMYFAALSTAITFGGLASEKTYNLIGISETLLSASLVGVVFHILSGQPLVIIGTTGPLLLFDEALYQFCQQNSFNFLTVRVYVGFWMAIIATCVSAFEGSVYVRLFTRFTQELFSALITLIYIVETGIKLVTVFQRHPLLANYSGIPVPPDSTENNEPYAEALSANSYDVSTGLNVTAITSSSTTTMTTPTITANENGTDLLATALGNNETIESVINAFANSRTDALGWVNQPNTALFCTILTLGTFTVAYYLRIFRNSHFLGRSARRALGDFGVPIAIALFVGISCLVPQVYTEKLSVPEGLSPSDPTKRGWLIPLDGVPTWIPFAAAVPALLVYILVFMETHISELIVDKPERGMKKGSGFHMDIVLLCFLNTLCGLFGMPWHCAATVRSVSHVSAVTIMSRTHAPGDKPHITDVKEQRVSGFIVSLMVGLSVTMAPLLRLIPMSVLFGVFLYMGVASMSGVQLFERLRLFFMPVKYHPAEPFVKRVPTWKMHAYTMVQVAALALLWTVKSSRFSLAFPFVLALMVPLRQRMATFFTLREMSALDGSQANFDPDDEPDFYEQTSLPA